MLSFSKILIHMYFWFYGFVFVSQVAALLLHLFLSSLHSIYLAFLNFCLFPIFSPHQNGFLSSFLSLGPTTRVLSYFVFVFVYCFYLIFSNFLPLFHCPCPHFISYLCAALFNF